jgi:hypothetical protein
VLACFNAAGSRVKTRKHSSAFTNQHAPLAEPVVSGNACTEHASFLFLALPEPYGNYSTSGGKQMTWVHFLKYDLTFHLMYYVLKYYLMWENGD